MKINERIHFVEPDSFRFQAKLALMTRGDLLGLLLNSRGRGALDVKELKESCVGIVPLIEELHTVGQAIVIRNVKDSSPRYCPLAI